MIVVNNKQRNSIITLLKILTRFNRKFLAGQDLLNTFAEKVNI
jgi:hypothetical protein